MNLDDTLEEYLKHDMNPVVVQGNPQEGFARALMFLYRSPSETSAKTMMDSMAEAYGKKELAKLMAKADEIVALLKKEQPA
jgi:hypothetical protein